MRYLLDASSIYRIAEANALDILADSMTLDLARYELGNTVLKEHAIHKRMDLPKAQQLIGFLYGILGAMDEAEVIDGEGIMKVAAELRLSFYDAAYVQYSKSEDLVLVTEDEKLERKAGNYVKIINASGLIKKV